MVSEPSTPSISASLYSGTSSGTDDRPGWNLTVRGTWLSNTYADPPLKASGSGSDRSSSST